MKQKKDEKQAHKSAVRGFLSPGGGGTELESVRALNPPIIPQIPATAKAEVGNATQWQKCNYWSHQCCSQGLHQGDWSQELGIKPRHPRVRCGHPKRGFQFVFPWTDKVEPFFCVCWLFMDVVQCLSKPFVLFFLMCRSSLNIFNISSWSDACTTNVFFLTSP